MGNTPEIRFKGFTDDWEQRKLGEVTQEFKSGNALKSDEISITGKYPVYGGNGLRGYTLNYNHDGEFALIGRQGALCGNMNYSAGKAYFTEHAVVVEADSNNNTRFLYYMLNTMNLGQYSDQSAQPGLAVNKLIKLKNFFPEKSEQIKIGAYFSNLDHLITLHQCKCDETKKLKKYMLQKMFPQKGEKNPEIRFSGFTDDWEQRKLGDYCDMYNGDRSSKYPNAQDMVAEGIPFINAGDLENGHVNLSTCNKISRDKYNDLGGAKLRLGDIVYCLRGTLGKNAYIGNFTEGTVASSLVAIRPKNIDGRFLFHVLNSDIEYRQRVVHDEGAAQPNLSAKSVSEFTMPLPHIDEQKKVSEYFDKLDHLITLHQCELEKLKNFKKFMLKKMFV